MHLEHRYKCKHMFLGRSIRAHNSCGSRNSIRRWQVRVGCGRACSSIVILRVISISQVLAQMFHDSPQWLQVAAISISWQHKLEVISAAKSMVRCWQMKSSCKVWVHSIPKISSARRWTKKHFSRSLSTTAAQNILWEETCHNMLVSSLMPTKTKQSRTCEKSNETSQAQTQRMLELETYPSRGQRSWQRIKDQMPQCQSSPIKCISTRKSI